MSGPVSALEIARLHDIEVHRDGSIEIRGFTLPNNPKHVWVKDGEREQRIEHACAHELGHHFVYDQDAEPALLEQACNRFAAALLMPAAEFARSVRELGMDLDALRKVWRFSSKEAIARRMGEVVPGVISAKWIELSPCWRAPREPTGALALLELETISCAYLKGKGFAEAESEHGRVRAWRVTSRDQRRALSVVQAA